MRSPKVHTASISLETMPQMETMDMDIITWALVIVSVAKMLVTRLRVKMASRLSQAARRAA